MKKSVLLIVIACLCAGLLTACGPSISGDDAKISKGEAIEIFDSNNQKIGARDRQEMTDIFTDLIGVSVENIGGKDSADFFKDVPGDAEISYHFLCKTGWIDQKATQINFYLYENYPYITMEGMPMSTSPLTWELAKDDLSVLQNYIENIEIQKSEG